MPNITKIQKTMEKLKIPEETMLQFDFSDPNGSSEPVIAFINKMDELLTHEQCLSIMEQQGCCKSGQREKDCKAFAKENGDKPLVEKIKLLSGYKNIIPPQLNKNGTITVKMHDWQNGVHIGKTTCSCGTIKKLKQPFSVSPTYCGCCAGHFIWLYKTSLGIKLRLKEINSSPLNTNGEKPCEFTFEIEV
jgi:hypothetical protein